MIMNSVISLPKRESVRFHKVASRYGFSPEALMRRIVADATRAILAIPEETMDTYDNPDEIKRGLRSALRSEREGKLLRDLPASFRRSK